MALLEGAGEVRHMLWVKVKPVVLIGTQTGRSESKTSLVVE